MALQRDARYPGRWTAASSGHPQGAFKNRTAPGSLDGSYIEQDWANDWDGYFSSLLSAAIITPNGSVDAVGASQYFTALRALINQSSPVIGSVRNLRCSVPATSANANFTANEIIVGTNLGAQKFVLSAFNKTINLATTGVGGMDTGTATANGFVGIYAIYNPTTQVSALLATMEGGSALASVYIGANMPAGFTASALISVAPISGTIGQFASFFQLGRSVDYLGASVLTASASIVTAAARGSLSIPISATFVSGFNQVGSSAACAISQALYPTSTGTIGGQFNTANIPAGSSQAVPFRVAIALPQNIYQTTSCSAGTPSFTIAVKSYEF